MIQRQAVDWYRCVYFPQTHALVPCPPRVYVVQVDIGRTTGPLRLVTDGRTFQPYQIR
jgi:hypothetical protein